MGRLAGRAPGPQVVLRDGRERHLAARHLRSRGQACGRCLVVNLGLVVQAAEVPGRVPGVAPRRRWPRKSHVHDERLAAAAAPRIGRALLSSHTLAERCGRPPLPPHPPHSVSRGGVTVCGGLSRCSRTELPRRSVQGPVSRTGVRVTKGGFWPRKDESSLSLRRWPRRQRPTTRPTCAVLRSTYAVVNGGNAEAQGQLLVHP